MDLMAQLSGFEREHRWGGWQCGPLAAESSPHRSVCPPARVAYGSGMAEIPALARDVIESGRLAHLVTVNADGSPHVTIVWVGLDGDDIVVGKLMVDQKVRNIRRDPRVSLSIEAEGEQYGMQHHLVVEGTARITEGGAPALLHALAQRYIGPGTDFPPMPDPPEGYLIRIRPTRVRGMGPWAAAPG
jgi:PPOX class probable F420-dependent enzyme